MNDIFKIIKMGASGSSMIPSRLGSNSNNEKTQTSKSKGCLTPQLPIDNTNINYTTLPLSSNSSESSNMSISDLSVLDDKMSESSDNSYTSDCSCNSNNEQLSDIEIKTEIKKNIVLEELKDTFYEKNMKNFYDNIKLDQSKIMFFKDSKRFGNLQYTNTDIKFNLMDYDNKFKTVASINESGDINCEGIVKCKEVKHYSDRRLKDNIKSLNPKTSLLELLKLNPVSYKINNELENKKELYFGLVAQEVQQVLPNIVENIGNFNDLDDCLVLNYVQLIPHLISSIHNLKDEIDILKSKIYTLSGANNCKL